MCNTIQLTVLSRRNKVQKSYLMSWHFFVGNIVCSTIWRILHCRGRYSAVFLLDVVRHSIVGNGPGPGGVNCHRQEILQVKKFTMYLQ